MPLFNNFTVVINRKGMLQTTVPNKMNDEKLTSPPPATKAPVAVALDMGVAGVATFVVTVDMRGIGRRYGRRRHVSSNCTHSNRRSCRCTIHIGD